MKKPGARRLSAPDNSERVLAIVLNWNLASATIECVRALLRSDYEALDVLVVDNGSTDGSAAILKKELSEIEILELTENRGFAGGNNAAILASAGLGHEWFLLINNDANVEVDTVGQMMKVASRTSGIVVPRIYESPSGKLWHAGARERKIFPIARQLKEVEIATADIIPIDYATGCVLLVHRRVFEEIGLLDERFFMYYEDLEFSWRARRAGFKLFVASQAVAYHSVGASLRHHPPSRLFMQFRSRTLWCRTNTRWRAAVWWSALVLAVGETTVESILRKDSKTVAATLRGILAGLRNSEIQSSHIPFIPVEP